jgi:hypothetical protein
MTHSLFLRRGAVGVAATVALSVTGVGAASAHRMPGPGASTRTGTLDDGATYVIEVPPHWNGTLLLFSHGLVPPGSDNPAVDSPDPLTGKTLLARGYALAGSSYATTGFAVEDALRDQTDLLGLFREEIGRPASTIAWGSSLGGMVTAALLEGQPKLFDGGLAMCGVLAGSVGLWDSYLDTLFALRTLIAPDAPIELVDIHDPFASLALFQDAIGRAQATPAGRARIALAAAVGDVPGWAGAGNPRPDPDDLDTQQAAQLENLATIALFGLALRADMESRAGGNPSTNVGVDYGKLLHRSNGRAEVEGLYRRAGLDLAADLGSLAAAPRIAADPSARQYLTTFTTFDGDLRDPLVTLHTAGDPLAVVEQEQAYRATVRHAGQSDELRQLFTERAGHCTFTPAEVVTALDVLLDRVHQRQWHPAGVRALNDHATALGADLNVHFEDGSDTPVATDPAFVDFRPGPFLRPFDRS